MSDYPMLISNKLHSFRNFCLQIYKTNLAKRVFYIEKYHCWNDIFSVLIKI